MQVHDESVGRGASGATFDRRTIVKCPSRITREISANRLKIELRRVALFLHLSKGCGGFDAKEHLLQISSHFLSPPVSPLRPADAIPRRSNSAGISVERARRTASDYRGAAGLAWSAAGPWKGKNSSAWCETRLRRPSGHDPKKGGAVVLLRWGRRQVCNVIGYREFSIG